MSALDQLRVYRGDVEIGRPPAPQEVLRWASSVRGFCAACEAEPFFEVRGPGLSGRTRSRSLVELGRSRGVIAECERIHCERCPPADEAVQIGVLHLLRDLGRGEAWCLRYVWSQPGAPVDPRAASSPLDSPWLSPRLLGWLDARVPRWAWGLERWREEVEASRAEVAAQRLGGELILTVGARLARLRWHPGVRAEVEQIGVFDGPILSRLTRLDAGLGGQLGVDLASMDEQRARVLGGALHELAADAAP